MSVLVKKAPKTLFEMEMAVVVLSSDHMDFLASAFPRLIVHLRHPSLFRKQSGITAILKYRSVSLIY